MVSKKVFQDGQRTGNVKKMSLLRSHRKESREPQVFQTQLECGYKGKRKFQNPPFPYPPMKLVSLTADPLCQFCLFLLRVLCKQILSSPFSAQKHDSLNPSYQDSVKQLNLAIMLMTITEGKGYPKGPKQWFYDAPNIQVNVATTMGFSAYFGSLSLPP